MPRHDLAGTCVPGVLRPCVLLLLAAVAPAIARPLNPEVSAIGDLRLVAADHAATELRFAELEVGIAGPLNPYARAEVTLAVHGTEGVEVEEARLHLDRLLPGGLGLTAGQYLLGVGHLNPLHAHAYPFVDRPLVHEAFFGEDGARDMGVRLDWLAPVDRVTLRVAADAMRGDVLTGGHTHHDDDHAHDVHDDGDSAEVEPEIGAVGRIELFVEPGDAVSFALGASVMYGTHDPVEDARATVAGPDLRLRWDLGPTRSLVVDAEALFGRLDATDETPATDPRGWFVSGDLRLSPRWNVGGFAEATTARLDDDAITRRAGAFAGLALMEETTLFRLLVRSTDPPDAGSSVDVVLQAIFGLGPHRPHRY